MPNHISNHLTIATADYDDQAEAIKTIAAAMKSSTDEKQLFDFNVLFPYPEAWDKADDAWHEAYDAAIKKAKETGEGTPWDSLPEDGYNHGGYEWCIEKWGTKWNAYEICIGDSDIWFSTAWSTPLPIFVALSEKFPQFPLKIEYADEDIGSNCGWYRLQAGIVTEEYNASEFPDADTFAKAVRYEHLYNHWDAENDAEIKGLKATIKDHEATIDSLKTLIAEMTVSHSELSITAGKLAKAVWDLTPITVNSTSTPENLAIDLVTTMPVTANKPSLSGIDFSAFKQETTTTPITADKPSRLGFDFVPFTYKPTPIPPSTHVQVNDSKSAFYYLEGIIAEYSPRDSSVPPGADRENDLEYLVKFDNPHAAGGKELGWFSYNQLIIITPSLPTEDKAD